MSGEGWKHQTVLRRRVFYVHGGGQDGEVSVDRTQCTRDLWHSVQDCIVDEKWNFTESSVGQTGLPTPNLRGVGPGRRGRPYWLLGRLGSPPSG